MGTRSRFLGLVGVFVLLGAATQAQQPRVANAKLETRSAAAGLEREFRALVDRQAEPAWLGYAVPIVSSEHSVCCSVGQRCCVLEDHRQGWTHTTNAQSTKLEGPKYLVVLYRIEQRRVGKIRTFSEDCELDAGGLPFIWLTDVRAADSVALLASFVRPSEESASEGRKLDDYTVTAIALHGDPAADRVLEGFIASSQPERLREKATFWLGSARGRRGFEILDRVVREDPSDRVRERAIFGLHVSKEPQAVDAMIRTARDDRSSRVRGQALFWLGQKAGAKAVAAITAAIENDPETEVKKKAVFALSQLPKEQGVPMLIQVARTNSNPAVRKQAMFWLGQSNDPRALAFFEEVLKR